MSRLQNVFVLTAKCICLDCKMYFSKFIQPEHNEHPGEASYWRIIAWSDENKNNTGRFNLDEIRSNILLRKETCQITICLATVTSTIQSIWATLLQSDKSDKSDKSELNQTQYERDTCFIPRHLNQTC